MERDKIIRLFSVKKHTENGISSFSADCPMADCTHSDESVTHYGQEDEARNATVGKMIVHLKKEHGIVEDVQQ